MHIVNCEHPLKVWDEVNHSYKVVPCGHCNTCNVNRSTSWISRLEQERKESAYTLFFTLTYAPEFLPLLEIVKIDFNDNLKTGLLSHKKRDFTKISANNRINKRFVIVDKNKKPLSDEYNSFEVLVDVAMLSEHRTENLINLYDGFIPYCSVYDCQTFIKRLRSLAYREAYGTDKGLAESQKIRYYLATEYGPTSYRPHIHGLLFFDDRKIEEVIRHALSKAWLLGNIEYESVCSSASSYVAKYLNSFSRLPRIYKTTALRPFALSSRKPPIGLRSVKDSTIKTILSEKSPVMPVQDAATGNLTYVPLWRSLENRLFPKLPYDSAFSFNERFELLHEFTGKFEKYFSAWRVKQELGYIPEEQFKHYISYDMFCSFYAHQYLRLLKSKNFTLYMQYILRIVPNLGIHTSFDNNNLFEYIRLLHDSNAFKQVYYVARLVARNCLVYGYSVSDYCRIYDEYAKNRALYRLQQMYLFEEDFCLHNDCRFLLYIDSERYFRYASISYSDLTETDFIILSGFGLSKDDLKCIYKDEDSRRAFFLRYDVTNAMDYKEMIRVNQKIMDDSTKTKVKNEYLEEHPELKTLI